MDRAVASPPSVASETPASRPREQWHELAHPGHLDPVPAQLREPIQLLSASAPRRRSRLAQNHPCPSLLGRQGDQWVVAGSFEGSLLRVLDLDGRLLGIAEVRRHGLRWMAVIARHRLGAGLKIWILRGRETGMERGTILLRD